MTPSVSIIIPTLNEERYIASLLSDIFAQTMSPREVIVVDGGSRDKTCELVRQFSGVRLFCIEPSVAIQRNFGAKVARGSILFFLDADTRLKPNFLEKSLGEFLRRGLDIACPLYFPYFSSARLAFFYTCFNFVLFIAQYFSPAGAGSLMVFADVFRESGGFDSRFRFEDIELIRRIAEEHRFRMLYRRLVVSPRRFETYGFMRTGLMYAKLAFLFALNDHSAANRVKYPMGEYQKIKNH